MQKLSCHSVQFVPFLHSKVKKDPIKHQENIVDTIEASLESPINSPTIFI